MSWPHDLNRWTEDYTRRISRLSSGQLRQDLRRAEEMRDFRRAYALRREQARRWAFVHASLSGRWTGRSNNA